jgi:hypothetical protein
MYSILSNLSRIVNSVMRMIKKRKTMTMTIRTMRTTKMIKIKTMKMYVTFYSVLH